MRRHALVRNAPGAAMTLIEAARAARNALGNLIDAQNGPPLIDQADEWDCAMHEAHAAIDALRAAIEAAEKAEPVAYRVECRWADPALDQTWHKYVDCTSRDAAEFVRSRFRVPGDMETRIVPMYAGTPEESR